MAEFSDLSVTDASNTGRWPENMAPSAVNNAGRADEGMIARWYKDNNGSLVTAGTSTAYTVTLNSQWSAWFDGLRFTVRFNAACGATPTINPTGSGALGAKTITHNDGTAIAANDIAINSVADLEYNSTTGKVHILSVLTNALVDPLTTRGDLIYRGASSTTRLAVGAANTVLQSDGTDASWGAVATAMIAANAVDGTKIAMGSDAQGDVLYHDGTDYTRLGAGTSGQFLKTQGAAANPVWANVSAWLDTDTSTTTGGTAVTVTGLTAGISEIVVYIYAVSTNSASQVLQLQIGDSGGLETTGYTGDCTTTSASDAFNSGFIIASGSYDAADAATGVVRLFHVGSNRWIEGGQCHKSAGTTGWFSAGEKTLTGEITQISLTTEAGTATFDAMNLVVLAR